MADVNPTRSTSGHPVGDHHITRHGATGSGHTSATTPSHGKNFAQVVDQIKPNAVPHAVKGMTPGAKKDYFNRLAETPGRSTGTDLAEQVFPKLTPQDQQILAQSVAAHGTTQTKETFIVALGRQLNDAHDTETTHGDTTTARIARPAAEAASTVLATLHHTAFERVVDSLSDDQLTSIVVASEHVSITGNNATGKGVESFDLKTTIGIVNNAADTKLTIEKQRVLRVAEQQLKGLERDATGPGGTRQDRQQVAELRVAVAKLRRSVDETTV